jgi:hypothetical protein
VRGHLLLTNCLEDEVTRPNIELALKEDRLLWLDLADNDEETLTLPHEVFKIRAPVTAACPPRGWRGGPGLTLPLGSLVPAEEGAVL